MSIRVAVQGALGQMGREVIKAVAAAPDMTLTGGCDARAPENTMSFDGVELFITADVNKCLVKTKPDVVVDFSLASAVPQTAETAARAGVSLVIGTTGLTPQVLARLETLTREFNIGIVVAPNFALGAVLMMELARTAAKYLDWAEIIELHHEKKADAPSGTAIATARMMQAARETPFESPKDETEHKSRGEEFYGVPIHSVRLPGLVAHQEVIFGTVGQTLSIRHDSISRDSFMPGVLLAVREIAKRRGQFIFGLNKLLGF
ncbi:4-hydroxy-tetrahydrodipicolinate reductase [Dehalogenimonas alkenigignens]|uniref:4-hydroxy-tetrahydrodipicolinate reductase n=1 Tax=Dehalogenimonas alkenigignens TaxID=1217799 RepID=A0A0W0GIH9_9CHLR|nr:4-hydroxy-tetrahydrodipicolinate reductase [Dehalogenimonas alkenigignens]KTB48377.1 dihydrodipicolinate reductase [Dehalogenimonas alkenigignens]PVV85160.1 4-hydroxy-tetrahydrodipicolinate reductase [Dehalogenimonas alkenigignens]